MDHDACACGSMGHAIKVERAMELSLGGESGINSRGTEQVQSKDGLWKKTVPEV